MANGTIPVFDERKPYRTIGQASAIPVFNEAKPYRVVSPEPTVEIPEQPPEHPIYMADKSPGQWFAKNALMNKEVEYKKRIAKNKARLERMIALGQYVNPEAAAFYGVELPDAPKPPKEKVPAGIYSKDLIARSQMEEMPIVPDQPAMWGGEPDTRQPIPIAEFTGVPDYVEPPPEKDLTLQPEPSMLSLAEEQGWDAMEHTAGSAFSSVAMAALNAARGIVELNEKIPTPKFIKDIKARIGVTALEEKGKEKIDDLISELGIYRQQMQDEIRKDGGVAAEVAQGIGDSALNTAAMLASLGVTGFTGAGATVRAAVKEAAKFGALMAATTPGSVADRTQAGAHAAVMMLMPIPLSKLPKDWMAKAANIIGLQGLSALAGDFSVERAKEKAAANGNPEGWVGELLAEGIPQFVINSVFGSLVKSAKQGKAEAQAQLDATPPEIRQAMEKRPIRGEQGPSEIPAEFNPPITVEQTQRQREVAMSKGEIPLATIPAEAPPKPVAVPVKPTEPVVEPPKPEAQNAVQEPVAKKVDVVAKAPDGKEVGKGIAKGEEAAGAVEQKAQGKVAEVAKPEAKPPELIQEIDPNTLTFREKEQHRVESFKNVPTKDFSPIVSIIDKTGNRIILDGHNRAVVAKERGDKINTVNITQEEYNKLQDAGFDDIEISWAALRRWEKSSDAEGYSDELNRQFSGASVAKEGQKALDMLEEALPPPAPGKAKPPAAAKGGEPTRQEQAKQGGFVATPAVVATPGRRMGDVADVIINSVKKNFTPSQGMNKTWNAIKDTFERSSDAGIEHAKKAGAKLTFARNELLKSFDKNAVETDINSVLDNKLSANDFASKYKLSPDNDVVKELNWVLADRERVANAAADQLDKAGQTEMAKLFRDNANTYLTRFYEKWIMGDAFTPKQEDYNLAMTALETRLVDDVSGTITKMEELKSKMSGKGIDTQKYFETGDESLIAGLTPEHQKTTRMLKDKYWGMKNLVRGDLSNLEVKADAIQTAAKDTLDYILTGKQISSKGASPIDVNHLTARDLTPIFRQLYGEIDTPIEKIQRTSEVQNSMLDGLILVNRLYDEGVGQWWSDRPSNLLSTKLSGARFGRLDGKFVSSQTASLLRVGSNANANALQSLWRGYEKTALPVMRYERIAQLGLSFPTTERNLLSGYLSYAMQCGDTLIEPALGAKSSFHKNIGKSIAFISKYAVAPKGSKSQIEALEVLEHLAELGVHHTADSGVVADIKVGLEGATAIKSIPAKVAKKLGDIYSYGDLITKYASFLTHTELNMAKGMSRPQAERAAATHVQTFYQHARSLPTALRQFSKLPFADYPSFYFDAIRIKKNGIINAAKEAANGNVRPLIGFALSNGLYALTSSGVSSWVGKTLGRAFYGDGNENKETMPNQLDYEQFNAIKEFQPDYWQRTPMVASRGKDKDGKPVIHYWIAGNLMGFPVDDAIIGAIQKRDAKTLLTELPTQLLKTGMTFNTLSKYFLGQEVGYGASNYKSRGILNWLASEDPAKAKEAGYLLKDMIIELALPVPRRVQQNVKRWDDVNEKVKAGKIKDAEGWEQKKDMLLSEILPVKCRSITQDVAKRMITNTLYPHIDVIKERAKTTSKASLGTTPTDTEKSKAAEAQEIINQEYSILANYVKKAKVAFKGILDDDLIMAILLDSGLSKKVVGALLSGDLTVIPDYTQKAKKQKRFELMTK